VCLLVAIAGWWPGIDDAAHDLSHGISPFLAGPERARVHMITHAGPELGRWHWQYESGLPADVQGEVVWSAARQEGYLTLSGLPPNERATRQYQLWIVDAGRDDRYPVDGGVFDVPAGVRKVTVRVQPALPIAQPVMFAVTLERAGGVVVSDRSQLVAVARTDAR
jgi:hypothetical protein